MKQPSGKKKGGSGPIAPESLSRSFGRDVHSRDDCGGTERDTFVEDRALSTIVTRALESCFAGGISRRVVSTRKTPSSV